jgi:hypothetical protein
MHRYQCPHCLGIHDRDAIPKCSVHGHGYGRTCAECRHVAQQIPCATQAT